MKPKRLYFPRDKSLLFVNTKESEIVTLEGRGKMFTDVRFTECVDMTKSTDAS